MIRLICNHYWLVSWYFTTYQQCGYTVPLKHSRCKINRFYRYTLLVNMSIVLSIFPYIVNSLFLLTLIETPPHYVIISFHVTFWLCSLRSLCVWGPWIVRKPSSSISFINFINLFFFCQFIKYKYTFFSQIWLRKDDKYKTRVLNGPIDLTARPGYILVHHSSK